MSTILSSYFARLETLSTIEWSGRITQAVGNVIESEGPSSSVGDCCEIVNVAGKRFPGEVVGFRGPVVLSMTLDHPGGIRYGDTIVTKGERATVPVGDGLLGRVIDAIGNPIDAAGPTSVTARRDIERAAPLPLERLPIREPLGCGIRALDAFVTCGRGQRIGIFGGSGVGKSTLIGMMTRGTDADLTVLALVGERGREVGEFLEALGPEGRRRSVVVVSTSDQSPLLRIRAAMTATAIAEHFASQGRNVLLVVDSLTRFAMAQREIGLAAGEPPTSKGYTPSVFSLLARLVERAGRFKIGSITAFYTVLMEADDQNDPLVDSVRSLLDGHVVLDRRLAAQNHYPPIAVLDSLSRLMSSIASREHISKAAALRSLMALHGRSEDLIRIGAYQRGSDNELDRAIDALPALTQFLRQSPGERPSLTENIDALLALRS